MKKITVIIAAYNAQNYIERCLDSVLCQCGDFDVVAVNDASTDRTGEILKRYGGRINLINLETNCGNIAKTRNIGLKNADGEYITFLDADDWYDNDALSKIIKLTDEYNPDILKYGYLKVYPDGTAVKSSNGTEKNEFLLKNDFKHSVYPYFVNGIGLNSVCCAVFKKDIIKDLSFSEEFRTAEDAAFAVEAYTKAQSVLFTDEHLYCYYQTGTGLTGSGTSILKKYFYNFMLSGKIIKFLPVWGMNTFEWKLKTVLRPVKLTLNKIMRK